MIIQKANPEEFPAIADLVARECQNPVTQCIHSSTGEDPASLLGEIEKWHQSGEIFYVTAYQDGALTGVMGCEYDLSQGRGWLRGPFAIRDWEITVPGLYNALLDNLPGPVRRLDTFLHIQNTRGNAFYLERGFEQKEIGHTYTAPRPDLPPNPHVDCIPLTPPYHTGFASLHDEVFPNTYYSGAQILEQLDENHQVFVYVKDTAVLGYLYIIAEPWTDEGYIEFLGVKEKERGQGIGGKLLATALHWAFSTKQVPQVDLTVTDANNNARNLYEKAGFHLKHTGVNTRLELPDKND